jgi:hypothetical protein
MSDEAPSAVVQEADCSERVVVLKIRVPGRTAFVMVGAARSGGAAGLLPQGARQELWGGRLPPGSPRQRARETALSLARVMAIVGGEVFFEPHVKERPEADADANANANASANANANANARADASADANVQADEKAGKKVLPGTPEYERARIVAAMERASGNQKEAARILGMTRRMLMYRLDAYGLPRPRKR